MNWDIYADILKQNVYDVDVITPERRGVLLKIQNPYTDKLVSALKETTESYQNLHQDPVYLLSFITTQMVLLIDKLKKYKNVKIIKNAIFMLESFENIGELEEIKTEVLNFNLFLLQVALIFDISPYTKICFDNIKQLFNKTIKEIFSMKLESNYFKTFIKNIERFTSIDISKVYSKLENNAVDNVELQDLYDQIGDGTKVVFVIHNKNAINKLLRKFNNLELVHQWGGLVIKRNFKIFKNNDVTITILKKRRFYLLEIYKNVVNFI